MSTEDDGARRRVHVWRSVCAVNADVQEHKRAARLWASALFTPAEGTQSGLAHVLCPKATRVCPAGEHGCASSSVRATGPRHVRPCAQQRARVGVCIDGVNAHTLPPPAHE